MISSMNKKTYLAFNKEQFLLTTFKLGTLCSVLDCLTSILGKSFKNYTVLLSEAQWLLT